MCGSRYQSSLGFQCDAAGDDDDCTTCAHVTKHAACNERVKCLRIDDAGIALGAAAPQYSAGSQVTCDV